MAGLLAYPSFRMVQRATQTTSSASPQAITDLLCELRAGSAYRFRAGVMFRSALLTNGIGLGLTCPALTDLGARVRIPQAADGTDAVLEGELTASGDEVLSTAVQAAATTYLARLEGVIVPSAAGTLQLTFRSENAGTTVAVRAYSWLELEQLA